MSGVTDNWHLHDLRRTARSLLARAHVASEVAERCLGHLPPTIEATYNHHTYADEMRHAYEALASLLQRIIDGPTDNIVSMRG